MAYKIHEKYAKRPELITNMGREVVNLMGKELKVEVPATKEDPAYTRTIRAATQEDLAAFYERQEANPRNKKIVVKDADSSQRERVQPEAAPSKSKKS